MKTKLIFDTVSNRVRKNKFLLNDSYTTDKFSGTDSKELFENNLKTQPTDWYYRHNAITYTVNSLGYRAPEFKNIDWENSIVVFGCSFVFGVGLDDKDTMPYQLSNILGMPVVNLGMGGSSITFSLHNSIILRDGYPSPKAVIQMWTGYDRTTYYRKKSVESCGSWTLDQYQYTRAWTDDPHHGMTHALFASKTSKSLWSDIKYFEGSYFESTAKLLNCYQVEYEESDYARDLAHAGKKTQHKVALKIAEELNL